MSLLKCPNPGCPYQFDSAGVPAGAVLDCPRCGQRFAVGPAKPPPAVSPPPKPARPPAAHGPRIGPLLVVGGVGLLVLGVIGAVLVLSGRLKPGGDRVVEEPAPEFRDEDRNFAFRFPGGEWQRDPGTAATMGVTAFALHRASPPEGWAALSVSDFKDRSPLASEMAAKVADHLGRLFQNLPAELPAEPVTWASQPALRSRFRGELKATGAVCSGEAYTLAHRGVGYWFYTWSAEQDEGAVAPELARARDGFRLLDKRANWAERTGAAVDFTGRVGNYRLTSYERIWQSQPSPDEEPKPDLELHAALRGRQNQDYTPRATVLVWVVPGAAGDDPLKAAEAFLRKLYKRDESVFGKREVTPVDDPPAGDPPVGPEGTGRETGRLRVAPADPAASAAARKFVVFAALPTEAGLVIVEGSCPWAERAVWERRLIQFAGSLRP
ncbi:MAG: hypothetical protein U0871_22015 [Gemmataceae bacterium]